MVVAFNKCSGHFLITKKVNCGINVHESLKSGELWHQRAWKFEKWWIAASTCMKVMKSGKRWHHVEVSGNKIHKSIIMWTQVVAKCQKVPICGCKW